jgi:hypothetical protein
LFIGLADGRRTFGQCERGNRKDRLLDTGLKKVPEWQSSLMNASAAPQGKLFKN